MVKECGFSDGFIPYGYILKIIKKNYINLILV